MLLVAVAAGTYKDVRNSPLVQQTYFLSLSLSYLTYHYYTLSRYHILAVFPPILVH